MILAAGRGERMRPVTERVPKPLVEVCGRPLLDWVLDNLAAHGIETVVVNTHHLGHLIAAHVRNRRRPRVVLSLEDEVCETGGGVARALPHLGERPFYVVNGDVLWRDSVESALGRLAAAWDGRRMDALLLLYPAPHARGYAGFGDYFMDQMGRLRRRREKEVGPYVFTGVQILSPKLFRDVPDGPFSLNLVYDRAEAAGRLSGIVHDGEWYHIGTPAALREVETMLTTGRKFDLHP